MFVQAQGDAEVGWGRYFGIWIFVIKSTQLLALWSYCIYLAVQVFIFA